MGRREPRQGAPLISLLLLALLAIACRGAASQAAQEDGHYM